MDRRRLVFGTLAFMVLAGLVGAACGGGSSPTSAGVPGHMAKSEGATAPVTGAGGANGASGANGGAALALPPQPARIVKTAQIGIKLPKGAFARQFAQPTLIAARHGGFVASSETEQGLVRSGSIVLRVPADQFEVVLSELRALGSPESETISGQDVSGQFVDLNARLRNWRAQEAILLGLMRKATTIDDSIKVEQHLQDVQLTIEQIQGQLSVLSDQADLSTITVSMREAGPAPVRPRSPSTISRAWRSAMHGSVAVVASIVVGLGYLMPLALLGLVLLAAWRLGLRRSRGTTVREGASS